MRPYAETTLTDLQKFVKMKIHSKYKISLEWLQKFNNIEKLRFLNYAITRSRRGEVKWDTTSYMIFIEKFYYDNKFNAIYDNWILKDKNKWFRPSLDHIIPKSEGGDELGVQNLQFLTWFENKAKVDMSQEQWNKIKNNIRYYLT